MRGAAKPTSAHATASSLAVVVRARLAEEREAGTPSSPQGGGCCGKLRARRTPDIGGMRGGPEDAMVEAEEKEAAREARSTGRHSGVLKGAESVYPPPPPPPRTVAGDSSRVWPPADDPARRLECGMGDGGVSSVSASVAIDVFRLGDGGGWALVDRAAVVGAEAAGAQGVMA